MIRAKAPGEPQRIQLPRDLRTDVTLDELNARLPNAERLCSEDLTALKQAARGTTLGEILETFEVDAFDFRPRLRLGPVHPDPYVHCSISTAALISAAKAHFAPKPELSTASSDGVRTHRVDLPPFVPILGEEVVSPLSDALFEESMAIDNLPNGLQEAARAAALAEVSAEQSSTRRPATVRLIDAAVIASDRSEQMRAEIVSAAPQLMGILGPDTKGSLKAELTLSPPGVEHERTVRLAGGVAELWLEAEIAYEGISYPDKETFWAKRSVRTELKLAPGTKIEIKPIDDPTRRKQIHQARPNEPLSTEVMLSDGCYRVRLTKDGVLLGEERLVLSGVASEYIDLSTYVGYDFRQTDDDQVLYFRPPRTTTVPGSFGGDMTVNTKKLVLDWAPQSFWDKPLFSTETSHRYAFGESRLRAGVYRVPLSTHDDKGSTAAFLEVFPSGLIRARMASRGMHSEAFDVQGGDVAGKTTFQVKLRDGDREEVETLQFLLPREIVRLEPHVSTEIKRKHMIVGG